MMCSCDLGGMRGKACHCRTCCLTFGSPSAFDRHLRGGGHRTPQASGLVEVRSGIWGRPLRMAHRGRGT